MTDDQRIADLEARVDALEIEQAGILTRLATLFTALGQLIRMLSPIITRYISWLVKTERTIPHSLQKPLPTLDEDLPDEL